MNFEGIINYSFKDKDLLFDALKHSSKFHHNNERLEFLGDRVLSLVVAQALYSMYPKQKEGELAKALSYLVSKDVLFLIAEDIGLRTHIKKAGELQSSMVADAMEALLAAIYLDSDLPTVSNIILNLWHTYLIKCQNTDLDKEFNPKSFLQEWAQKLKLSEPSYLDDEKLGSDHNPWFQVRLVIEDYEPILGFGPNKKLAQKNAALNFINKFIVDNNV